MNAIIARVCLYNANVIALSRDIVQIQSGEKLSEAGTTSKINVSSYLRSASVKTKTVPEKNARDTEL